MKLNSVDFFEVVDEKMSDMVEQLEVAAATDVLLKIQVNGRFTVVGLDAFSWGRMESLLLSEDDILQVDGPYTKEGYVHQEMSRQEFASYFESVTNRMLNQLMSGDEYEEVIVTLSLDGAYTELLLCANVYHILLAEIQGKQEL